MSLSLAKFQSLALADQLGAVLSEGTYLARRYEEEDAINLYHLGNFFVEVYYDPEINHMHQCYSFVRDQDRLADYAASVKLQGLDES